MLLFPDKYSKPGLLTLAEASELGWGAVCSSGTSPGTSGSVCSTGGGAGASAQVCLAGGTDNKEVLYHTDRLLNEHDVGQGL